MPKGNRIGNRKLNWNKKGFDPIHEQNTKIDRSTAGLMGNVAYNFKKIYENKQSGIKYRVRRSILIYCLHKHEGLTIADISKEYRMRTDDVRRALSMTKRLFDKWRNDYAGINE